MIGLSYGNFQAVTTTPFSFGNALQFDGVNDYVITTYGRANLPNGSSFSIGCWVNIPTGTASTLGIYQLASSLSSAGPFVLLQTTASGVRFLFNNAFYSANIIVAKDTWTYISFSYDGANYKTYKNGVLQTTNAGTNIAGFANLYLGNGFNGYFGGIIDEFALWESTLTAAQFLNQYNGGNGNFANIDVEPEIWFKLDESGSDTTAVNSGLGGNSFDGTLNNFPASGMWVAH